jgi:tetratricopeptide (TPR) repeat protein
MRTRGRAALVIGFVVSLLPAAAVAQAPAARHLIIPFEVGNRDPRAAWLGEGSSVILTDDFQAMGVGVIGRDDRLRAMERLRVPAVTAVSHATVIRLGNLLGATRVVLGTVELTREVLTVRARAIRLDSGQMTPEITEAGPLAETFAIYGRVARRLVPDTPVTIEQMERGHPPIAAFEQYVRGLTADVPAGRIALLEDALRQAPDLHRARLALWEVHTEAGEHAQALAAVSAVPADHRLIRRARFLASVSMIHLAQYQQAFDTLFALNAATADSALLNNLGVVQLRRGAATGGGDRAVSYFTDASRLDGTDPDLFFNLGYAFWLEKDPRSAIHWLREAVRRNPADEAAHYVLGVALQATGSTAEATREKALAKQLSSVYAEWEARQPADARPGDTVPRGLERVKEDVDVPAALRVENMIVAAEQRDQRELVTSYLQAGQRLFQAERDAEAIAELRRAVYLAPYDSDAHLLLGRAYLRSGRLREAIDALKISIWSEERIAARLVLADAYLQLKDTEAARAEIDTVLGFEPANAAARALQQKLRQSN